MPQYADIARSVSSCYARGGAFHPASLQRALRERMSCRRLVEAQVPMI